MKPKHLDIYGHDTEDEESLQTSSRSLSVASGLSASAMVEAAASVGGAVRSVPKDPPSQKQMMMMGSTNDTNLPGMFARTRPGAMQQQQQHHFQQHVRHVPLDPNQRAQVKPPNQSMSQRPHPSENHPSNYRNFMPKLVVSEQSKNDHWDASNNYYPVVARTTSMPATATAAKTLATSSVSTTASRNHDNNSVKHPVVGSGSASSSARCTSSRTSAVNKLKKKSEGRKSGLQNAQPVNSSATSFRTSTNSCDSASKCESGQSASRLKSILRSRIHRHRDNDNHRNDSDNNKNDSSNENNYDKKANLEDETGSNISRGSNTSSIISQLSSTGSKLKGYLSSYKSGSYKNDRTYNHNRYHSHEGNDHDPKHSHACTPNYNDGEGNTLSRSKFPNYRSSSSSRICNSSNNNNNNHHHRRENGSISSHRPSPDHVPKQCNFQDRIQFQQRLASFHGSCSVDVSGMGILEEGEGDEESSNVESSVAGSAVSDTATGSVCNSVMTNHYHTLKTSHQIGITKNISPRSLNSRGIVGVTLVFDLPWSGPNDDTIQSNNNGNRHKRIQGRYSGPVNELLQPHGEGSLVLHGNDDPPLYGVWENGSLVCPLRSDRSRGGTTREKKGGELLCESERAKNNRTSTDSDREVGESSTPSKKGVDRSRGVPQDPPTSSSTPPTSDHDDGNIVEAIATSNARNAPTSSEVTHNHKSRPNPGSSRTHRQRHPKYVLGEVARTPRDMMIYRSNNEAIRSASLIKKLDQAFIKRSNGLWTCAILADRALQPINATSNRRHDSSHWFTEWEIDPTAMELEDSMLFVINEDGATKIIHKRNWGKFIRRLRSFHEKEQMKLEREVGVIREGENEEEEENMDDAEALFGRGGRLIKNNKRK